MPTLRIVKEIKTAEPVKITSVYLSTHGRLTAFSAESGIPITKILKLCVDFALDNAELIDPKALDTKTK